MKYYAISQILLDYSLNNLNEYYELITIFKTIYITSHQHLTTFKTKLQTSITSTSARIFEINCASLTIDQQKSSITIKT